MNPLVTLIIQELPSAITAIQGIFARQHPNDPVPTDDEVIAAYQQALASSLAKDDQWLAQHSE